MTVKAAGCGSPMGDNEIFKIGQAELYGLEENSLEKQGAFAG